MCTFKIYYNVVKSVFRVPFSVFSQIRCIGMVHQFKVNTAIKYPKRELPKQVETMLLQRDKSHKSSATRAVDRMNYYSALGLDKNASLKEIKRAYYFLARKHHPDSSEVFKSPDSEKRFQEITEAYTVLSDEIKRRQYDMYGIIKNMNKTVPKAVAKKVNEENVHQVFEAIDYENKSGFLDNPNKIPNENTLKLTFLESVRGATKDFTVSSIKQCPRCSGSSDLTFKKNLIVCDKCSGSGLQPIISSTGHSVRGVCKSCRGRRYVPQHTCSECSGRGIKIANKRVEVHIPPGIDSGDIIKFPHPDKGQQIAIRLSVAKDNHFSRVGNDINSDLPITLSQAVLGGVVTAKGIYENHKVVLEPGTESGTKIRLIGKGVKTKSAIGDHYLKVHVKIPKILTTKQKALMAAFAEVEADGPDRKAELRKSRIKDELANLHNLNRFIPQISRYPQKQSVTMALSNQLPRSRSNKYRAL